MPWTTENYLDLVQIGVTALGLGLVFWQILVGVEALKKSAEANEIGGRALQKSAEANEIGVKALQKSAEANEIGGKALQKSAEANEIAVKALQKSAEANEHSAEAGDIAQLMVVLQIELQLGEARMQLIQGRKESEPDSPLLRSLQEHYLNALDRFCHCVRLGLVDQTTYRLDYKRRLEEAISNNRELFQADTPFQHIFHVHKRWSEEQDAADFYGKRLEARKSRVRRWSEAGVPMSDISRN